MMDRQQITVTMMMPCHRTRFHELLRILGCLAMYTALYTIVAPSGCITVSTVERTLESFVVKEPMPTPSVDKPQSKAPLIVQNPDDDRPLLILHVGLPKTGTTFSQCSLCEQASLSEPILLEDNLVFIGTCPHVDCYDLEEMPPQFLDHWNPSFFNGKVYQDGNWLAPLPHNRTMSAPNILARLPNVTDDFIEHVETVHAGGHHGLIIYEGLHIISAQHIRVLAEFLKPKFQVHVLVAYRPLYEWLPSKYNSLYKPYRNRPGRIWPGLPYPGRDIIGEPILPFDIVERDDFSTMVEQLTDQDAHPASTTADNFRLHFDHVHVLGLHQMPKYDGGEPLLRHLFCTVLEGVTPHVCAKVIDGTLPGSQAGNPSYPFNYDLLAVAAFERGLIDVNDDGRPRKERLVREVQHYQQETLNRTSTDFPLVCWPKVKLASFERLSWDWQQRLFGNDDQAQHRQGFRKAVKKNYCHVNVTAALALPEWQAFFAGYHAIKESEDEEEEQDEPEEDSEEMEEPEDEETAEQEEAEQEDDDESKEQDDDARERPEADAEQEQPILEMGIPNDDKEEEDEPATTE